MKTTRRQNLIAVALALALLAPAGLFAQQVPLPKTAADVPGPAFGKSDGDLEMLQWTTVGAGARFALIVHHTDAEREWAYDQNSSIGRLDKALDEAQAKGWTVVDMKNDWKVVFPFEGK
jgi:hypothetical protein